MSLTSLYIARRAAAMFLTEPDPTKLSESDTILFADALSAGISDYWNDAPAFVTAPQGEAPLVTVSGTSTVALPAHFQSFQRDPWLRLSASESWHPLILMADDPQVGGTNSGRPSHYRVINAVATAPVWDADGNDPAVPALQLWPTPDAVYSIDVWCHYSAPRIRLKHLSGPKLALTLPIPEDHLFRIVLPLCGEHMITHPLVKADRIQAFLTAAVNAREAMTRFPRTRTPGRGRCGTPHGF